MKYSKLPKLSEVVSKEYPELVIFVDFCTRYRAAEDFEQITEDAIKPSRIRGSWLMDSRHYVKVEIPSFRIPRHMDESDIKRMNFGDMKTLYVFRAANLDCPISAIYSNDDGHYDDIDFSDEAEIIRGKGLLQEVLCYDKILREVAPNAPAPVIATSTYANMRQIKDDGSYDSFLVSVLGAIEHYGLEDRLRIALADKS
jgi:hypothetical protein